MNPEYVPSKELCIDLKAAGFPQETEFYWIIWKPDNDIFRLVEKKEITHSIPYYYEIYSAPLSDELLKWLPLSIRMLQVTYKEFHIRHGSKVIKADTLPNALAEMGICLGEEGLV